MNIFDIGICYKFIKLLPVSQWITFIKEGGWFVLGLPSFEYLSSSENKIATILPLSQLSINCELNA